MKKKHQRRSKQQRKTKRLPFKKPNTARQYFLLSSRKQEIWDSVGHVISKIRQGMTLPKAAKEFSLPPKTVIALGRPALRKRKNGRYVAKKSDELLRVVNVLTTDGRKEIATRDSRQASVVGSHWAAVQRFLQTGDDSALLKFAKKRIVDAGRKRYRLLTDLKELERQGSAGRVPSWLEFARDLSIKTHFNGNPIGSPVRWICATVTFASGSPRKRLKRWAACCDPENELSMQKF
jgi:hypothetical protein